MSEISAAAVRDLRQRTGLGVMTCKQALVETGGDPEQAVEWLRRNSGLKAASKSGRVTAEGAVMAQLAADKGFGILVEINCETDFVARDQNFLDFCQQVLSGAVQARETDPGRLVDGALEEQRQALVQKVGENISVRRIAVLEAHKAQLAAYVHGNSRLATLVAVQGGDAQLARDIAMHVAAQAPQALQPEELPPELVEREERLYLEQAGAEGKPPAIAEKIAAGRLKKFLAEQSLVLQPFVRDPELSVGELVQQQGAQVQSFVRYAVGEPLEREETAPAGPAAH